MIIEFTARHFHAPDNIREYAESEVQSLTKYNERITQCQIILIHEHDEHTVELNLSVPGTKLNTRIASDNMTKSIDLAVDKMGVRLKKFTSKQQAH